jgi:hypothetical protein
VRALWISAIFIALPLAASFMVFLRRDVAGEEREIAPRL